MCTYRSQSEGKSNTGCNREIISFLLFSFSLTRSGALLHVCTHCRVCDGTLGWLGESAGCGREGLAGKRGNERSSSYHRQLISQTPIAGQLFKAFSRISYRRKPLKAPPISPGREGHESGEVKGFCRLCVKASKVKVFLVFPFHNFNKQISSSYLVKMMRTEHTGVSVTTQLVLWPCILQYQN